MRRVQKPKQTELAAACTASCGRGQEANVSALNFLLMREHPKAAPKYQEGEGGREGEKHEKYYNKFNKKVLEILAAKGAVAETQSTHTI